MADQLRKAAADIDKLAEHELPLDVDHAMTQQLKDLAKSLQDAADQTRSAAEPGLSAAGVLDKLQKVRKQLGVKRDQLRQNAVQPLEHLAKIYPLIEDQARFLDLYARQKDLADRMSSIQGQEANDDPKIKAQMRDYEDEQRQIRDDLNQLLDDIDNHVAQLPEDPQLDNLRNSAKKFSTAVRASPAVGQMQDAESALEEFAGTLAMTKARAGADTLNEFISRCQGVGKEGQTCLNFQPKLSTCLGDTINQMLGSMSLSMGMGSGGVGGYSEMRSSLQNVGLYGTIPMQSMTSAGGGGQADHGIGWRSNGSTDGNDNPDHTASGKQHASGQSDAPVPAQYKKRVGEYFQRVSDELSD